MLSGFIALAANPPQPSEHDLRPGGVIYPLPPPEVRPLTYEKPIAKAVDDWLLMERKAQAWDEIRKRAECENLYPGYADALDAVWGTVHPAQDGSSS